LFTDLFDDGFWDAFRFREQNALDTRPQQDERTIEALGVSTGRAQKIEIIWRQWEETTRIFFADFRRRSFVCSFAMLSAVFLFVVDSAADPV
jgi:hypothetical protein